MSECSDESLDLDDAKVDTVDDFQVQQIDYEPVENDQVNSIDCLTSPAKLWKESVEKKIIEVRLARHWLVRFQIGLYDDRCEDDRLAVESFYYCDQLNLLACGLYGGVCIVLSTSDETNSTSSITVHCLFGILLNCWLQADELKFVDVKMSEAADQTLSHDAIKIQNSALWNLSLFKPKPHILCLQPQTPIRTLSVSDTTGMVAIGCSTGIVVFDATSGRVIYFKNFLNYQAVQTVLAFEKPLNRLKTMKQTVRKTFRGKSLRMSRVS